VENASKQKKPNTILSVHLFTKSMIWAKPKHWRYRNEWCFKSCGLLRRNVQLCFKEIKIIFH